MYKWPNQVQQCLFLISFLAFQLLIFPLTGAAESSFNYANFMAGTLTIRSNQKEVVALDGQGDFLSNRVVFTQLKAPVRKHLYGLSSAASINKKNESLTFFVSSFCGKEGEKDIDITLKWIVMPKTASRDKVKNCYVLVDSHTVRINSSFVTGSVSFSHQFAEGFPVRPFFIAQIQSESLVSYELRLHKIRRTGFRYTIRLPPEIGKTFERTPSKFELAYIAVGGSSSYSIYPELSIFTETVPVKVEKRHNSSTSNIINHLEKTRSYDLALYSLRCAVFRPTKHFIFPQFFSNDSENSLDINLLTCPSQTDTINNLSLSQDSTAVKVSHLTSVKHFATILYIKIHDPSYTEEFPSQFDSLEDDSAFFYSICGMSFGFVVVVVLSVFIIYRRRIQNLPHT